MAADSVYWSNFDLNTISRTNLDGTGSPSQLDTTGTTVNLPEGVTIDSASERIFWANSGNNTISYASLSGGAGGTLNTSGATVNVPVGVTIDSASGKIYWDNLGNNTISYASLSGGAGGTLDTSGATVSGPIGLAIDRPSGRIFWTNTGNNTISYASLSGGAGGTLNTSGATVNVPVGLAINSASGRIYWSNYESTISYASLSGGAGGTLDTSGATVNGPYGLAIDPASGRIYWANLFANKISYLNLGGGGAGQISTGGESGNGPNFLALLRTPEGTALPTVSGATAPGSTLSCSTGIWGEDLPGAFLFRAPHSYTYSWSLNGAPIAGASAATLVAVTAGTYSCTVTATNQAGAASQTSAPFSVLAPAKLALTVKPRKAKAQLGGKVTFKAVLVNSGNLAASGVRLCTTVPKKARKEKALKAPKCKSLGEIVGGARKRVKLKVKLGPGAHGSYRLVFKASARGVKTKAEAKAKVVVKLGNKGGRTK